MADVTPLLSGSTAKAANTAKIATSAGSELLATTWQGITQVIDLARNNTTTGLRQANDLLTRRIAILQERLSSLQSNEDYLLAKIYTNIDSKELEQRYKANHFQKTGPVPSVAPTYSDVNPFHNIPYNMEWLRNNSPGFKELEAEINKVQTEIKAIGSEINHLTNALNAYQKIINNQSGFRINVETDRTAKAIISYLFLLQSLCKEFAKYTTDPTGANKNCTGQSWEEKRTVIREQFKATVRGIGQVDPQYISGPKKLNLSNPGDPNNLAILNEDIKSINDLASKNSADFSAITALKNQADKFVNSLVSTSTDPIVSKSVNSRQSQDNPSDSLAVNTKSLSYKLSTLGDNFWTKWIIDGGKEIDAVLKTWMGYNNKILKALQPCTGKPIDDKAEEDRQKKIDETTAAQKAAAKKVTDAAAAAAAAEEQANKNTDTMNKANARYVEAAGLNLDSNREDVNTAVEAKLRSAIVFLQGIIIGPDFKTLSPTDKVAVIKMKDELNSNLHKFLERLRGNS